MKLWCLPFSDSSEKDDMERNRMAVIAAHSLLLIDNKLDVDTHKYKQLLSGGEIQATDSAEQNMLTLARIGPWKFNGGVSLWFGFFVASLGQALFDYFSGVVDKMEKLENY